MAVGSKRKRAPPAMSFEEKRRKAAAVRRIVRDFFMGICKAAILSPEVRGANGKSSQ
jgi:hypothetical protein